MSADAGLLVLIILKSRGQKSHKFIYTYRNFAIIAAVVVTFFNKTLTIDDCQRNGYNYIKNSSAVAEMGDRDHNRHVPKRGGGCRAPFAESWDPL